MHTMRPGAHEFWPEGLGDVHLSTIEAPRRQKCLMIEERWHRAEGPPGLWSCRGRAKKDGAGGSQGRPTRQRQGLLQPRLHSPLDQLVRKSVERGRGGAFHPITWKF